MGHGQPLPVVPSSSMGASVLRAGAEDEPANDDRPTSEPPRPQAGPTSTGECSDLSLVGRDGGMVLGTDWSSETHPYDRPIDLTVCVTTSDAGRVGVESSDARITVTPRAQDIPATSNGDTPGPSVVTTADGWHFDRR
jgi:hypothetical protein